MSSWRQHYELYLHSGEWAHKRGELMGIVGASCEFCGAEDAPLDVHHLTYETLGHESTVDVAVLCRWCHSDHHDGLLGDAVERVVAARRRVA